MPMKRSKPAIPQRFVAKTLAVPITENGIHTAAVPGVNRRPRAARVSASPVGPVRQTRGIERPSMISHCGGLGAVVVIRSSIVAGKTPGCSHRIRAEDG